MDDDLDRPLGGGVRLTEYYITYCENYPQGHVSAVLWSPDAYGGRLTSVVRKTHGEVNAALREWIALHGKQSHKIGGLT